MAIYNVNGNETDNFTEAVEYLRAAQTVAKAPAVQEQHAAALMKPSELDLQRAARGVTAPEISADAAVDLLAKRADAAAASN